ncbi:MAG TPA: hypothetical protein VEG27_05195 [Usitatibacter sp.]|nr:hypothetical protein [Usitatibacter sp.]
MRIPRAAAVALTALLVACSQPLPPARSAYVGDWRAAKMRLAISSDGFVRYVRATGRGKTSISAPIRRFEGDNFVVGVGVLSTTFVVSRPPHVEGGVWKMTVDGVELVRQGPPPDTYTSGSVRT